MRMNLLRQRLRGLIKFVSCHNQNDANIKHAITKVFIRKVLKQSKERAQPLERADEKRANKVIANRASRPAFYLIGVWKHKHKI